MSRLFIYWCEKCGDYAEATFTMARTKQEAWDEKGMQDKVKGHDLMHQDLEWPKGKVVCLVPLSSRRK